MPVGTQGTVKGLTVDQLRATGAQMILANTYHLALRPGEDVVAELGGLHRLWAGRARSSPTAAAFNSSAWPQMTKISEAGAVFRSHIDGSAVRAHARAGGRDSGGAWAATWRWCSTMSSALPNEPARRCAMPRERTHPLGRALPRRLRRAPDQALFAIVQGGLDPELRVRLRRAAGRARLSRLRRRRAERRRRRRPRCTRVLDATVPALPADRPRYLMGVGRPQDLLEAIRRGIDLFDCVLPTRNGRNALAFTDGGPDAAAEPAIPARPRPLEAGCPCPACRHSRGYLRHLFMAGEMLGPILVSAPQSDLLPAAAEPMPGGDRSRSALRTSPPPMASVWARSAWAIAAPDHLRGLGIARKP